MNTKTKEQDTFVDVVLTVGGKSIPAILNGCRSSRELCARLPYTVTLDKYEHDYCGVMQDPLPYDKQDLRHGWHNGDIAFAADGNYFAILYKDEDISQQFGNLVTLGSVRCDLSLLDTFDRTISLTISFPK